MTEHAKDDTAALAGPSRRTGACRPAGKVHRSAASPMLHGRAAPVSRVVRAAPAVPAAPDRTFEHIAALERRFDGDAPIAERVSPLAAGIASTPTRIRRMPAVQRTPDVGA